uniref:hypothetical protein n=1 Tax=Dyadobacter frigoris TaxID=2576211 RepID=UPI0025537B5A|nr:hypothetical protein [Dyadobacter frigoris]
MEVQSRYFVVMAMFLKKKGLGKCTGISFMDSTTAAAAALKVWKNQSMMKQKIGESHLVLPNALKKAGGCRCRSGYVFESNPQ